MMTLTTNDVDRSRPRTTRPACLRTRTLHHPRVVCRAHPTAPTPKAGPGAESSGGSLLAKYAMKLVTVLVAGAGLIFAFQPDAFKTTFARYYEAEVHTIDDREAVVQAVLNVARRPWYEDRILGRRIELQVVFYSRESGGNFVTVPEKGKTPSIELPTTQCPGGKGNRLRLFIYNADDGRFGFQNATNKEYLLNGIFEVDDIHFRVNKDGAYCYADLRLKSE
jgi:hypothetical protein